VSWAGDFRGSDAAASLKRIARLLDERTDPGFPRQRCRGLIEADRATELERIGGKDFRGSDAAASLKPRIAA